MKKLSKPLHVVSAVSAVLGAVALLGFWWSTEKGTFLGLTPDHLAFDAMLLLLASIAFGTLSSYHMQIEKKK